MHNEYFNLKNKYVLSKRGYRPHLIKEDNLAKRFKRAGYSESIVDNLDEKITDQTLYESVLKSQNKFSEQYIFKGNKQKLVNAALRVYKNSKFPKRRFEPLSLDQASLCLNKTASSGFPYFLKKGDILDNILDQSKTNISNPFNFDNFPMTVGFRAQIRGEKQLDVKLRVMYPITAAVTLYETCFVKPFIEHYSTTDTFYSIGRTGGQTSKQLFRRFSKSNNLCSLDIEAFDQSMINEVIILAFAILRKQLRLSPEFNNVFEFCLQYFLSSIISYKVGAREIKSYIKVKGIPSGSGFTNIIGTLCHAIILEYLAEDSTNDNALICADDNIFDYSNYNIKNIFHGYKRVFNLKVSTQKTNFYNDSSNFSFLGFNWINFQRNIKEKLAINQCIWHTKFRKDLNQYEREIARSASTLLNGRNGSYIFKRVFPDVMNILSKGKDISFIYLQDNRPPSKLSSITNSISQNTKESLTQHLKIGYLIR